MEGKGAAAGAGRKGGGAVKTGSADGPFSTASLLAICQLCGLRAGLVQAIFDLAPHWLFPLFAALSG